MDNYFDVEEKQKEAIKSVLDIHKKIDEELSKGSMADKKRLTILRYEQMLKGLFITQDPTIIK